MKDQEIIDKVEKRVGMSGNAYKFYRNTPSFYDLVLVRYTRWLERANILKQIEDKLLWFDNTSSTIGLRFSGNRTYHIWQVLKRKKL